MMPRQAALPSYDDLPTTGQVDWHKEIVESSDEEIRKKEEQVKEGMRELRRKLSPPLGIPAQRKST